MSILNRIKDWWSGKSTPVRPGHANDPYEPENFPSTSEKARAGPMGVYLPAFLPYFDDQTGETPEMRRQYRYMLTDPNVAAPLCNKIFGVGSLDLRVQPYRRKKAGRHAKPTPASQEHAEFTEWTLKHCMEGGIPSLAWNMLSGGLIDGFSILEKVWQPPSNRGDWGGKLRLTALKPKDVDNDLVLVLDQFRNIHSLLGVRYNGGLTFDVRDFIIYSHLPLFGAPTGTSLFRWVYGRYWMLDTVTKLRAMGAEKRALPTITGEYPDFSKKAQVDAALALLKSQNFLSVPQGVKLQILEMVGAAGGYFESFAKDLREEIVIGITGAVLQQMQGGQGVQRGSSEVHEDTSDLGKWFLRSGVMSRLNSHESGLIPDLIDRNYPQCDGYPMATFSAIDYEAIGAHANIVNTIAQAFQLKVSKEWLHETFNIEPANPDDPDDVAQVAGQGGAQGQPGQAGGSPDSPGLPSGPDGQPLPNAGQSPQQGPENLVQPNIEGLSNQPAPETQQGLSPNQQGQQGEMVEQFSSHQYETLSLPELYRIRDSLRREIEQLNRTIDRDNPHSNLYSSTAYSNRNTLQLEEHRANYFISLKAGDKQATKYYKKLAKLGENPSTAHYEEFTSYDKDKEVAGRDQQKAQSLLSASQEQGSEVLSRLTKQALQRALSNPESIQSMEHFFSPEELQQLREELAKVNATAELLGRARVRNKLEQHSQRSVRQFSETKLSWRKYADGSRKAEGSTKSYEIHPIEGEYGPAWGLYVGGDLVADSDSVAWLKQFATRHEVEMFAENFDEGEACRKGETAAKTDCIPAESDGSSSPSISSSGDFKKFDTEEEMEEWADKHYEKWSESLSKDEWGACLRYMGRSIELNDAIRHGGDLDKEFQMYRKRVVKWKEWVSFLDSALEKSKVPEDIVVYRGLSYRDPGKVERGKERKEKPRIEFTPGMVFQDDAFVSTTLHKYRAERFGSAKDSHILTIRIPKGSPGAVLRTIQNGDLVPQQHELLLPRKSKFKIISVNGRHVEAEYVNE
jgi:hypothetical protein